MSKRVAIVTGASRGIGAATAKLLAQSGYLVVLTYRSRGDEAELTANSIVKQGGECFVLQVDVSVEQQILKRFHTVDEQFGRLDALVNNAGILERQCAVRDVTLDRLERIFSINVFGAFLCCREAARLMSPRWAPS